MGRSILVTGASGFLARALLPVLRNRGEDVIAHTRADGDLGRDKISAENVRHVYHLAARTFVPDSWEDPAGFYQTNVMGTVNVCEFCRRTGASLTLMSSYVYGEPQALPISEDAPLDPFNPYAHSKILAENIAMYYARAFDVRLSIVRGFNLYGPSQSSRFLVPMLIEQALSPDRKRIEVADTRPRRDFIFVEDVVNLLAILLESSHTLRVYNAGSGKSVSVKELGELIAKIAGGNKPVVGRDEERPAEVLDVIADISRARAELNWTPKVSLEEGLRRTVTWMESRK